MVGQILACNDNLSISASKRSRSLEKDKFEARKDLSKEGSTVLMVKEVVEKRSRSFFEAERSMEPR